MKIGRLIASFLCRDAVRAIRAITVHCILFLFIYNKLIISNILYLIRHKPNVFLRRAERENQGRKICQSEGEKFLLFGVGFDII